jgi:hypothetical protein
MDIVGALLFVMYETDLDSREAAGALSRPSRVHCLPVMGRRFHTVFFTSQVKPMKLLESAALCASILEIAFSDERMCCVSLEGRESHARRSFAIPLCCRYDSDSRAHDR